MPAAKVARKRKLPVQQLSILAICRFAEPIATTSLFPYLPEMVKSFNVPEDEVGKWSGICSGVFSVCQAIMGVPWGLFSDRYGRKPAILLGLTSTMIMSLMWGFSTSLPMAITARCLAGAGNGNVGIIRTTVAEMVPFKELQPRAFSLMPLVWNTGSIFGPMVGGALANPFNVDPREHIENPSLLERFPYALPNIISACIFVIGITVGFLFLHETLESRSKSPDYGRIIGQKLIAGVKRLIARTSGLVHLREDGNSKDFSNERQPLLKTVEDEEIAPAGSTRYILPPTTYREVFNKQAVLNLLVFTLLAMHTMAYDNLLPVFMNRPWFHPGETPTFQDGNPLKFSGGLGLGHLRIGLITTVYGACGMTIQFLLYPPVARRFGILNCLKACAILFPIAYFITPFTALLPTTESQIAGVFAVMMLKCVATIFAFPSSTILLTNSASSMRVLGTLNGFATSFSAVGRAMGPAMGGSIFSLGVKNGYVIAPWWTFSALGIVAAIPVWFLVEQDGFGDDNNEEHDEEILYEEGLEGEAVSSGEPGPILIPTRELVEEPEEGEDDLGPLTRSTTASSHMTSGSGGIEGTEGGTGASYARPAAVSRRSSRTVLRRMSTHVGTGREGISRSFSSNLGQSLGTAGSYHG